ncbi:YfjI family protein [Peribacillus sp. SCS-155]|uniref:YfjI family protein n=1 Tax=Peribacillus sedimenti TaxID=3115297 RepID=UPI0039066F5B
MINQRVPNRITLEGGMVAEMQPSFQEVDVAKSKPQPETHSKVAREKTFPVSLFPAPIREFIVEQSKALGCPSDFLGIAVLATASTAIGNSRKIQLKKNWREGAALYCGIVAEPGSKKTSAISKALQPLKDIQEDNKRIYDIQSSKYSSQLEWIQAQKELHKKFSPKLGHNDSSLELPELPKAPKKPQFQQIITVDATMESLLELLSVNAHGVIQYRDELVSFVKSMNQYRAGADRQYWLSMWSNESLIVNRKGSEPLELLMPFCTVIGGIQPDVLESMVQGNKNDGFLDRFLFAYPMSQSALWTDDDVTEQVNDGYANIIKAIYKAPLNNEQPWVIELSAEAKTIFTNWYDDISKQISDPALPVNLKGVYEKLKGQCARIMLILHTLRWFSGESEHELSVDRDTATYAVYLVNGYFKHHISKVFQYLGFSETEMHILKIIQRMKDVGEKDDNGRINIRVNVLNKAKILGRKTTKEKILQILMQMQQEGIGELYSEMIHGKLIDYFALYDGSVSNV